MGDIALVTGRMTSLEIASLTGKAHDKVVRDIEKMFVELEIDNATFGDIYYDKAGREQRMYSLDKRLSLALVSGYSAKLRVAIIDRWEQLESGKPKVPQTYLEALEAHVETLKQLDSANLMLQSANKTIEKLTHVGKLYTTTEIAKELGMKSANEFNKSLEAQQIQYKSNGTWVLRAWYADKGFTSIKQMELDNGRVIYDRKWTQIGREFLLDKFNIF